MSSTARRAVRAAAAVTGIAALGAGFAGTAFAEEPQVHSGEGFQTASVDGFDTESIAPTGALTTDVAGTLAGATGQQAAPAAGPTDITSIGQMQGFTFELPPTEFKSSATGMESQSVPTAGEEEFASMGLEPMMTPMMQHALPAITGGQQVRAAEQSETFGNDNGLPQPVDGPANEAAGPVTGSVMPAVAMMTGTVTDSTTNDDTTSNHEFQL